MRYLFVVLFLYIGTASASGWSLKKSTDAMSDEIRREAFLTNADGDKFTVIRRSDDSVWGYLQLSGLKQFSVGDRLMLRVDKNKPIEFNEDLENLLRKLGKPIEMWEWNPNLIGFRMWHGKADEGCDIVLQLYKGSHLVIRYHPNESTEKDISFHLIGNRDAIFQAIDLQISKCAQN